MTWQKRLRVALGVFVLLFAAGVYLAMRRQAPAGASHVPDAPSILDPKVATRATSGELLTFKRGAVDYKLYYDEIIGYVAGNQEFRGVKALAHRKGRDIEITGDKAAVAGDQSTARFTGHVQLKSSDGLVLMVPEASYSKAEGIIRSAGPVNFTRGAVHGSAAGMTYDDERDVLTLLDQVAITSDGTDKQPQTDVHAGTVVWARADKYSRYERGARIVRGTQTFEADTIVAYLTPDERQLQRLEMQGNSRITGEPPRPTAGGSSAGTTLRGMRARDITLTYGPDGEKLQQAVLTDHGSVEVSSSGAGSVTRIAGDLVDFGLEEDGASIKTLSARGKPPGSLAELDLPAQADTPARQVRAVTIQAPTPGTATGAGRGLTTMRLTDSVEYRETPKPRTTDARAALPGSGNGRTAPAANGGARVATARMLDLVLQPGLGALEEARFSGNAALKEGTSMEATAREARYSVKAGTFEFTGADDQGALPRVKDQDQATIQGNRIVVTPDTRRVLAWGKVQATIQPSKKQPDGKAARTPGILRQDQPALATSDDLDYDGAASRARFTSKGQSKLWQAQGNSIFGTTITVDDSTGNLEASGGVVSTMKLEQKDAKTGKKEPVNSIVRADAMAYDDANRRATYTGHVQMTGGPQGNLKAARVETYLGESGGALDRLEAYDDVQVDDPGTEKTGPRQTTGDRLTYLAADESYKVTGKLVKINEQCLGETTCHTLTFYRSVDRMIVDGNMRRRTQTKGGQGCK